MAEGPDKCPAGWTLGSGDGFKPHHPSPLSALPSSRGTRGSGIQHTSLILEAFELHRS